MFFTEPQLREAFKLRASHMSWRKLGDYFGCSDATIKEAMFPAAAKGRRERQTQRRRIIARSGKRIRKVTHVVEQRNEVPLDVVEERDLVSMAPMTLTQSILGDPKPGRSALDKRKLEKIGGKNSL